MNYDVNAVIYPRPFPYHKEKAAHIRLQARSCSIDTFAESRSDVKECFMLPLPFIPPSKKKTLKDPNN